MDAVRLGLHSGPRVRALGPEPGRPRPWAVRCRPPYTGEHTGPFVDPKVGQAVRQGSAGRVRVGLRCRVRAEVRRRVAGGPSAGQRGLQPCCGPGAQVYCILLLHIAKLHIAIAYCYIAYCYCSLPSLIEGGWFCLAPAGLVLLQQLVDLCQDVVPPQTYAFPSLPRPIAPSVAVPCAVEEYRRRNVAAAGGEPVELHGERKVLNKYFPPDFDPSAIPRKKMDPKRTMQIRMMLPFSLCCSTCNNFMYAGTKFNSKKEDVMGPDGYYLGIKIFRFTIKCTVCSSALTFKTDPKNGDYEAESGCTRNFEMWREKEKVEREMEERKEADEEGDAMRQLENKTMDSKIEMDILDALDEMRAQNARHEKVDVDAVLAARAAGKSKSLNQVDAEKAAQEAAADDEAIRAAFGNSKADGSAADESSSASDEDDKSKKSSGGSFGKLATLPKRKAFAGSTAAGGTAAKRPALLTPTFGGVVMKKDAAASASAKAAPAGTSAVAGLIGGYGSGSDSSDT
eukprot:SAG31_NODE_1720_length_7455_cov_3.242115_8_plen_511_part_00